MKEKTARTIKTKGRKGESDFLLLMLTFSLVIFGTIMVFSASYYNSISEYGNPYEYLIRQVAWAGIGTVAMLVLSKVDYREKVQRLVEPRAYPHDDATRDFGYAPMGFAEGVAGEVAAYLEQKARA